MSIFKNKVILLALVTCFSYLSLGAKYVNNENLIYYNKPKDLQSSNVFNFCKYPKSLQEYLTNNIKPLKYEKQEKNNYEIKSIDNDTVFVLNDSYTYESPNEYSDTLITLKKYDSVLRVNTFTNGWSLIKKDNQDLYIQTKNLVKKYYLGDFKITYYCPCKICNGNYGPYDKNGNKLIDGTAAVDPKIIPMGTTFEIDGSRICTANDVGGAIKGKHIDVFVNVPHKVCENMGNTKKSVYIFKQCE